GRLTTDVERRFGGLALARLAENGEGSFRRLLDDFEERSRRATRRAFALLPVAHGLDRNADASGESGLGQASASAHIARVARILLLCIGRPRSVAGSSADRLRIGRNGTLAAVRQNLNQTSVCFKTHAQHGACSGHLPRHLAACSITDSSWIQ